MRSWSRSGTALSRKRACLGRPFFSSEARQGRPPERDSEAEDARGGGGGGGGEGLGPKTVLGELNPRSCGSILMVLCNSSIEKGG